MGRLPLTSCQFSPASSLRMTSQCFCMKSVSGRDGCIAMRWTQWPTSALGSGMYCDSQAAVDRLPRSCRRRRCETRRRRRSRCRCASGSLRSSRIVCRPMPPAPGCHLGPARGRAGRRVRARSCRRRWCGRSRRLRRRRRRCSGSVSDGSRCQTRLNSHGCCVPSYHWCVVSGFGGGVVDELVALALGHAVGSRGRLAGRCPAGPMSCRRRRSAG